MKQDNSKLTDKQENFAITFVLTGNKSEAYRQHYNAENMSDNAIWVEACRLAKVPKVALRIDELRQEKFSGKVLSIQERKVILTELAVAGDTKAIDLLNKMEGTYVEKKEVNHTGHITMLPAKDEDN